MAPNTPLESVVATTTSTAPDKAPLKVKQSNTYDGSRATLRQFVAQMGLYIKFNHDRLPIGNDKVLMAFSYLRGRAFDWINTHIREWKVKKKNADEEIQEIVNNYDRFTKSLKKYFGNADKTRTAERTLQTLTQKGSAAAYTAEFKMWALKTDWNDEAQMAAYYKGFKEVVKDNIVK